MKKAASILMLSFLAATGYAQQQQTKPYTAEEILQRTVDEENKDIQFKTIGILIYDGFAELDAIGPQAALQGVMGTEIFFVAKERGLVKGSNNTFQVDRDFANTPELDVLLIPGGLQTTYLTTQDTATLNWIRKIDSTSSITASVCTGAWILGAAGLLEGKRATSHWYRAQEMLEGYGAQFEDKRWVQDGKYWTAAGVSAGIDMGLAMIEAAKGRTYAEFVALNLEYAPEPPVEGGSKETANPGMVEMLSGIYDLGLGEVRAGINRKE